jgi:DNA-binding response OmpR family regulator
MEAAAQPDGEVIRVGELEIRPADGLVLAGGRALTLSVREFELLVALARSNGRIVRREDLYARVWGGALRAGDRSIDVYVHKLRVKLEDALPSARYIHTHVGFGYRFSPEGLSHAFHIPATGR